MQKHSVLSAFRMLKKLNAACATLAGAVLLFITFSIFVDVFLRYFFNRPSIWITEVSTYLFLYVIFLGSAYALQQGMHIKVEFIVGSFGLKAKKVIGLLTALLSLIFCLVLIWQTSVITWTAFKEKWTSPTMLSAPYAFIYMVMVFGSVLLFLTLLLQTIAQFTHPDSYKEDSTGD